MKVVILGGSGAIGSAIRQDCLVREIDHLAISRHIEESGTCRQADLSVQRVSRVTDLEADDIAIVLFGYADQEWIDNNIDEARRVNYYANIRVIDELIEKGVYIVYFSTVDVFRQRAGTGSREFDSKCPQTLYGRMKSDVEDYLVEHYDRYLIARSGWVIAQDNDCVIARAYRDMRNDSARLAYDAYLNISHVDDVASALMDVALQKQKDIVHLVASETPTRSDMGDVIVSASQYDLRYTKQRKDELGLSKNISFWLDSSYTNEKYSLNMRSYTDIIKSKIRVMECHETDF